MLEEMGCQTVSTTCPKEALTLFSGQAFDLVITDHAMPEMTGVELIRAIRAINASVPIILLSGFSDVLGLSEANTGADAVIMKSNHEVAQLIWTVGKIINPGSTRKPPTRVGLIRRRKKDVSSS